MSSGGGGGGGSGAPAARRPLAVLDAQNIGWCATRAVAGESSPLFFPAAVPCLVDTIAALRRAGVEAVAFLPAHWLRAVPLAGSDAVMLGAGGPSLGGAEAAALRRLVAEGAAVEVPSRDKDDPYILNYAHAHGGCVISNDRFRDWAAGFRSAAAAAAAGARRMELDGDLGAAAAPPPPPPPFDRAAWLREHCISFALRPPGEASECWELIPNPLLASRLLPAA